MLQAFRVCRDASGLPRTQTCRLSAILRGYHEKVKNFEDVKRLRMQVDSLWAFEYLDSVVGGKECLEKIPLLGAGTITAVWERS